MRGIRPRFDRSGERPVPDPPGCWRVASGAQAGYILERLADLSRPFGTQIDIKGETADIRVKR